MIDVASYTNHRTSSKNDTPNKYPVYSAQVYADLSNIKDYTVADTEQPKSTETPLDVVRIYITPATVKKRLDAQQAAVPTTQPPPATVTSMSRTSPHPMVFVTAANGLDHRDQRSGAVYSVSSTVNVYKEPADYRTSTVAESGRKSDGAKAKQAVKAQSQSQHLLYATTQSPLSPQPQPTFAVAASKAQPTNSSSVSKPFATVLVPKQMLDGGDSVVGYSVREDSFRPIAAPLYSYRPNAVDSNSVPDNRRMSAAYYNVAGAAQTASVPAKSVNSGYAKSDAYKVLEEHGSSDRSFNVVPANKQLRDKPNHQQPYVDRPLQTTENPVKRDHAKPPKDALPQKHYGVVPEKSAQRYAGPEPSKYDKVQPYKSVPPKSAAEQVREFYPATEVPARDAMSYSPYNSAGKYDARSPPLLSWEREKSPGSPPNKVLSGPSTWSTAAYPGPVASGGAEFAMDDVNAKDVLKSILRDMLKSKQQAEVKQPSKSAAGTDEFVDSYFKINPVDLSFDSSDVETGKTVIDILYVHIYTFSILSYITKTVKEIKKTL